MFHYFYAFFYLDHVLDNNALDYHDYDVDVDDYDDNDDDDPTRYFHHDVWIYFENDDCISIYYHPLTMIYSSLSLLDLLNLAPQYYSLLII